MRRIQTAVANNAAVRWAFRPRKPYALHLENVLGTSLELLLVASGDRAAHVAERDVLDEIDRLASHLSGYVPTSEFHRWQQTLDCDAVVSDELANVLASAEQWRLRTGGAFNVGAEAIRQCRVAGIDVEEIVTRIREPLWRLDLDRSVARRIIDVPVSLDAIAKGFIVTRAAAAATKVAGIADVVLNVGGDIQHFGTNDRVVGIAHPLHATENAAPMSRVRIRNEAVATSGGYRRGFIADGSRHSHIIDPRTGRAATEVISASVIAVDCVTADALSTAFSVLTPAESVAMADAIDGIACLIVSRDGTITSNSLWKDHESVTL